jgi:hypothetical protein
VNERFDRRERSLAHGARAVTSAGHYQRRPRSGGRPDSTRSALRGEKQYTWVTKTSSLGRRTSAATRAKGQTGEVEYSPATRVFRTMAKA